MLTVMAIVPAVVLMIYIYRKDKVEREPLDLLLKIYVLGMISVVPVGAIGQILSQMLEGLFAPDSTIYIFIEMFFVVALVEEYWKRWAAMSAWEDSAFNYRFDAVVYCVFAAMGFALVENLLYVWEYGMSTAIARAFLSVPGHATDGVLMGCFLGEAKLREQRWDKKGHQLFMRLSLIIPMLAHGLYDFALSVKYEHAMVFFFILVIGTDIWAICYINHEGKKAKKVNEWR